MLQNFIYSKIKEQLPFEPTSQQDELLSKLGLFMADVKVRKVFLLKGYAGTGKTSVVSALVRSMNLLQQKTVLLAPTGRAAKVLAAYSGFQAYTIHKKIYRQKTLGEFNFQLADNLHTDTLFVVDEASMISNLKNDSAFGSGCLLDDLISYVFSGNGCILLLLGDIAQLPPVMQPHSPALEKEKLEGYGLYVTDFSLTQVVRQALESGILYNATIIRHLLAENEVNKFPHFKLDGFIDICKLNGMDLIDEIQKAYREVGEEETIVVTRTNKRANLYNNGIRSRILMREGEISNGDLLMVTKNNYFWNKAYSEIDFIANGDILEIIRVKKYHNLYGFRFAEVHLKSLDFGWEIEAMIWLDTINLDSPNQNTDLQQKLFEAIAEDFPEITNRKLLIKKIYENVYFNALQIKFAYAVTCHKAQGGQWKKVFIDPGQISDERLNSDFYRWLYTALTRATENIYLVNFPEK